VAISHYKLLSTGLNCNFHIYLKAIRIVYQHRMHKCFTITALSLIIWQCAKYPLSANGSEHQAALRRLHLAREKLVPSSRFVSRTAVKQDAGTRFTFLPLAHRFPTYFYIEGRGRKLTFETSLGGLKGDARSFPSVDLLRDVGLTPIFPSQ
jgi:hypothetical protein